MLKPLKPFTTKHQQLKTLKSRGLIVDDEPRALHYLEHIGYYHLSGYFYPFRQLDSSTKNVQRLDMFIKDSHFTQVLQLYLFDKKLRLLAFDALERIEKAIRVNISTALARRNITAHEDIQYLDHKYVTNHLAWLSKYYSLVERAKNQDFIKHNLEHYGKLPVWVACEILDFGALSKLYGLLNPSDRVFIAKKYKIDESQFGKWLKSLNFIRNVCAHHTRLWNVNVTVRFDIKQSFPQNKALHSLENHKPFIYFFLMKHFLSIISPKSNWNNRLIELLEKEFPVVLNNAIYLKDFGAPNDFKNILLN